MKIDITPSLNIFNTYKNFTYNISSALFEYFDNSTSSFFSDLEIKNDRTIITLIDRRDKTNPKLMIIDNAFGMDDEAFKRAIKIDNVQKKTQRNKFGVGLKVSAIWFSDVWSIETLDKKTKKHKFFEFDLDKIQNSESPIFDTEELDSKWIGSEYGLDYEHGTIITLNSPRELPTTKVTLEKLVDNISTQFSRDIKEERVNFKIVEVCETRSNSIYFVDLVNKYIYQDEKYEMQNIDKCVSIKPFEIKWKKINGVEQYEEIEFEVDIPNDNAGIYTITGVVGWIENSGVGKGGFRRLWNGRVLENNSWKPERILGKPNGYVAQRMYGELDFSSFEPTNSKDNFLISSDLEEFIINEFENVTKSLKRKISKISKEEAANKKILNKQKVSNSFRKSQSEVFNKKNNSIGINVILNTEDKKDNGLSSIIQIGNVNVTLETKLVENFKDKTLINLTTKDDEKKHYIFEINKNHKLITSASEENVDNITKLIYTICYSEIAARIQYHINDKFDDLSHIKRINKTFGEENE